MGRESSESEPNEQGIDDSPSRRLDDGGPAVERPASTLMVKIDGFESVAQAKRRRKIIDQVTWVITDTMRSTDAVYRHGDAGFCVVMAKTPENESLAAADRLRSNVEAMPLLADAGITVTVGVAVGSEADLDRSIARAEAAIMNGYVANRVVRASESAD